MKNLKFASLLATLFVLVSCSKKEASSLQGIIGDDSSEVINVRPSYGEFLAHRKNHAMWVDCNAVRIEGGELLTAGHCLKNKNLTTLLLSGKVPVKGKELVPDLDLARISQVGASAPSSTIAKFKGTLSGRFAVESEWFDVTVGRWKRSSGTALVRGRFLEHDLDMKPGASGAGLYVVQDERRELVAVHLGFNRIENRNLAALVPDVRSGSADNYEPQTYEFETERATCYYKYDKEKDEVVIDRCEREGPGNGGGDSSDPGDDQGGDPEPEESDTGSDDEGTNPGIPGLPSGPSGPSSGPGSEPGGATTESRAPRDCFNCDQVFEELKRNDTFGDDCDSADAGLIQANLIDANALDFGKEEDKLPELRIRPKDGDFTESLRKAASELIAKVKWQSLPTLSSKIGELSTETVEKLRQWTNAVIRDLDDYYALVMETVKSDAVAAPELPEVDLSKESIQAAQEYLDAVKQQILKNPDQYQKTRLEIAESSGRALALANESLAAGNRDEAEAALELGRALADASLG
nr:serine protease [Pseudobdellovibrionaceae bacterium]